MLRRRPLTCGIIAAAALTLSGCAPRPAQVPESSAHRDGLILSPEYPAQSLAGHLYVLGNADRAWRTPADLAASGQIDRFQSIASGSPSYGFTPTATWIRFDLRTPDTAGAQPETWYLEAGFALLDEVDLFLYRHNPVRAGVPEKATQPENEFGELDRAHSVQRSGRLVPLAERPVAHQKHVFRLHLQPGQRVRAYLRVTSTENLLVPLNIYSETEFRSNERLEQWITGLYFGMLLAVLLYNGFLYASLREADYLRYCLYLSSLILWQIAFLGFVIFLFPENPVFAQHYAIVAAFVFMISVAYFVQGFLQQREHHPRLYLLWQLAVASVLLLVCVGLPVFGYYPISIFLTGMGSVFITLVLVSGWASLRRGFHPAGLFLAAWIVPMLGMSLVVLRNFGLVPTNLITDYAGLFGTALEAVLLSLALADRIHRMKRDLENFNQRLEVQVQDRMRELESALGDLKREDARHRHELTLAADIQAWVLGVGALDTEHVRIRTRRRFPGIVGGDFYDTHRFSGGETAVLLADISGHGVPAGFLTAMLKMCFHDAARRNEPDPRAILLQMNTEMHRWIKTHDYFTAVLLVIDSQRCLIANAGHPPALYWHSREDRVQPIESTGMFLGIFDSTEEGLQGLTNELVVPRSGDRLLLCTDGVSDAVNTADVAFAATSLSDTLQSDARLASQRNLQSSCDAIFTALDRHLDGAPNEDDCTVVVLEFH